MKKFRVYDVYTDDGHDCYKLTIPAESVKAAELAAQGCGEIIRTKENPIIQDIDTEALADTLFHAHWGQLEIDVITRALAAVGLAR